MNKNQKNKKILFTLLLTLTFVVGLIPLGIRGANADELTQPLEQMIISTTAEQLKEVEVSVPDEGESSEKDDQEIEVENSEVPEKEALEPNATKEEKTAEEAPPVVEEKPVVEVPPVVEEKPAEEVPPVSEEKPKVPTLEEKEPIEEVPPVEEKELIEEPVKLEKDPEKNTIAEYAPPVLEQPKTVLPNSFYERFNVKTTPLEDTIKVDKTAERSPGCRTYEVTLSITGTPPKRPVDVVLVIDTSGSMAKGEENYAYENITSTPDTKSSYYVKIGNSYQSVSYVSGTWRYNVGRIIPDYRYVKWDKDGDDSGRGSTNSNNPLGKPFYVRYGLSRMYYAKQAAANFANKVLGPDRIDGNRVSIVSYSGPKLTSDYGAQNQAETNVPLTENLSEVNAAINSLNATGGTNTEAGFLEAKSVIEGSDRPNSKKVVIMFTDGLPTASNGNQYNESTNISTVHNQRALAAGKSIFGVGHTFTYDSQEPSPKYHKNPSFLADVFTIGLLEGMKTAERNLAIDILEQTNNKQFYEAPTAAELDNILQAISEEFDYSAENAVVVDKIGDNFELVLPLPDGATYNADDREITWDAKTIKTSKEYKYIVQAKPDFPGGWADTNESAKLTYKDIFGTAGKTKDFPVPRVNVPTRIEISLTNANIALGESIRLGTGEEPGGDNYMSPVTGGDNDKKTFKYEWKVVGDDTIISTEKNPEVSPIKPTSYEVTVTDSNGCKATAKMTVTPTVAVTKVEATKKWVGGPSADHTAVKLDLYREVDGQKTIVIEVTPNITGPNTTEEATIFNYVWENLPKTDKEGNEYTYTVEENGVTSTKNENGVIEGKVDINGNKYIVTQEDYSITNTYESPKINVEATKKWVGGFNEKPTIQLQLYRNRIKFGDPVTPTKQPDSTYTHTWEGLDETDDTGKPYIYTVDEVEIPEYHMKNPEKPIGLKVTNTHQTGILKVSKKVTGNLGDKSKFFDVVVTFILPEGKTLESPIKYTGGKYSSEKSVDGQQVIIEIKDGQTIEFTNVPYGVKYEVKEKDYYTSEKYETEHEFSHLDKLMSSEVETVDIINDKEVIIDTGIGLDSLTYIIILILLATGGIGGLIWKRKQTELD